jgi:hypothetical protein
LVWGLVLVGLGALFLLQSLGVLGGTFGALVLAVLFGLGGVGFLYVFVSNRAHWWAAIPGFTLVGLGSLIGLDAVAPRLGGDLGAALFLASISLSFWVIYFTRRQFWWAIIPGGVMASVATVVLVEAFNPPFDGGAVMMLGLGATFFLVSLVRNERGGTMRWALIPAGVLSAIGLMILLESAALLRYLWPAILIVAGLYFVLRSSRESGAPVPTHAAADDVAPASQNPSETNKLNNPWDEQPKQ